MEPDRGGNGARLGPETPHSVEAKTETTVIVASADELRERARAAIREAFAERPMLTVPQIIEHDPDDKLNSDES